MSMLKFFLFFSAAIFFYGNSNEAEANSSDNPANQKLSQINSHSTIPLENNRKAEHSFSTLTTDNNSEINLPAGAVDDTETDFVKHCPSCQPAHPSPEFLNIRTCNLVSHEQELMDGTLSDYWAQELIGSDLLREELEKIPAPEMPNWIAVFDSQGGNHNIYVKNLISDEGLHAVLPDSGDETVSFFQTNIDKEYKNTLSLFETDLPGNYESQDDYLRKKSPHFINNSMPWTESKDIYEVFQNLSPPAIIVISSGNVFPSKLENIKSKASKNFDAILVGSFSPSGFVSGFSNSGEEVHIIAPSDGWLTSAGKDGKYRKFGGTSGAAPLVTGSLAGFEWFSGYHPTSEEAKILLEKTALPTLNSHEEPQVNGVGLLNTYKLGEVGRRLKEKCKDKSLFCFKEEILDEENYFFNVDESLAKDLNKAFPNCAVGKKSANFSEGSSCEEKGEVLKRLRRTILLNPENSREFLKSLSCIYREGRFSQNGEALDKLSLALGSKEEVRASVRVLAREEKPISDDVLRFMLGMGGFEEEFKLFEQRKAVKIAGGIGKSALFLVERAFNTGDPDLQETAVLAAGDVGESALFLVEAAFDTGNPDLQLAAVLAAGRIGESALPLLERAFNTGDPELQIKVVRSAGKIRESALFLVKAAFDTGNPDLQRMAVNTAGRIGESALFILERAFNTGDPDLQEAAVLVVGDMGKSGLPLLERAFNTGDPDLQRSAVIITGGIGRSALPLLNWMLENENLDPESREIVKYHIKRLE